jgi:RHS repeat-associated protein
VRDFGYDALNRLVSVRQGGVLMARYAYDVLGRRIAKRVYSSSSGGVPGYTRFVYHGDHVAFQADSAGVMGLRFTWGLGTDDLRAITDGASQHYYIVQDKLGSVRGLVQRDGTWRFSARYGPYGGLVALDSAGAKPASWYAWTGREFDEETGWYYHRARYYSPLIRRFVQEDPIGYGGGTNLYAYVEGQALEATDPSGAIMCNMGRCGAGGGLPQQCVGGGCGGRGDMGGNVSSSNMMSEVYGIAAGFQAQASSRLKKTTFEVTLSNGRTTETIQFRGGVPTTGTCALCKQLPDGAAGYAGMAGDFFYALGAPGATVAYGVYVDNKGGGGYLRFGVGSGYDISLAGEIGYSTSFRGFAGQAQLGIGDHAVSAGISFGLKGVSGGGGSYSNGKSLVPGISGHGAVAYTRAWQTRAWN